MAKKEYKLASPEGVSRYAGQQDPDADPVKVGATVELDLDDREETAVVAAGWLEPVKKKGD